MKKFRTKKIIHNSFVLYIVLFLITIIFSIKFLDKQNLVKENTIINRLLNNNLKLKNENIMNAHFLMKYTMNLDLDTVKDINKKEKKVVKKEENINKLEIDSNPPLVYIYNTHPKEQYKSINLESFNIAPNVVLASKILKECLEKEGINTIVEEKDLVKKLYSLNWRYGQSYKVSRMFLEEAVIKYPTLNYFIDIHRDSSIYDKTTFEIDNQKYVKILFVVGMDNNNYEPNLKLAEILKDKLIKYNANLCRGIMKKSGKNVNGVYNQDFHPHTILIEVGGQYNNINEVNNTLKIFANIFKEYIKEDMQSEKEK